MCSRACLSVFALAWLVAACSDAPAVRPDPLVGPVAAAIPAWVSDGNSAQYPDSQWLQAVGAAEVGASVQDARERAELKARAGLVRSLSSTVRSSSELHELFRATDDDSRLQVSMEQTVQVVGEGTLEGARPADFFVDEGSPTAYCLLVLERSSTSRELARRVEQKEADAAALLARAKAAPPGPALLTLCEAYDNVVAARLLRASYAVLAGGPLARRDAIGDDVLATLGACSSELSLRVESGQGQAGRVGSGLAAPVVFQLLGAQGRGVDGVELQFALLGKAKAELSAPSLVTVAGGAAALAVRALAASGQRSNQIECRIAALARRGLRGPVVVAEYLLPSAADTRVLVASQARVFGEPSDAGKLTAGIVAALGAVDFALVAPSSLADRLGTADPCDLSVSELCRRLGGSVDWVVRVQGSARDAAPRGERMRARASADVTLIDVASGEFDRFASEPADGLGDSHEHAAEASLERLSALLGGTIVTRLRARVGL